MKFISSFFCSTALFLITNHVNAVDQFRISCDCTERYGWLSLNNAKGNWQLSKLRLRVDEFSGFFAPEKTPPKNYAFLQVKELKEGKVLTPDVAFNKIDPFINMSAISYRDHNFDMNETITFVFLGKKYEFVSVVENNERFLVLKNHRGQFRIGKLYASKTSYAVATIDWSGDVNRDGELDFVVNGLLDPNSFLLMSTKGNCYRKIFLTTNDDYIQVDGHATPVQVAPTPDICGVL